MPCRRVALEVDRNLKILELRGVVSCSSNRLSTGFDQSFCGDMAKTGKGQSERARLGVAREERHVVIGGIIINSSVWPSAIAANQSCKELAPSSMLR